MTADDFVSELGELCGEESAVKGNCEFGLVRSVLATNHEMSLTDDDVFGVEFDVYSICKDYSSFDDDNFEVFGGRLVYD